MAAGNSSRGARRRGRSGGNRPRTHPAPSAGVGLPERPGASTGVAVGDIHVPARRFEAFYRAAITVEIALQYQNANQDGDFADCLRHAVSAQIWDQSEKAHGISKRLDRVQGHDLSRGRVES